jgi:hypothetical protein
MCCFAVMSPRSMRFASTTSSPAVSSSTLPIERRYRRSESSEGSTVRSSSSLRGATGSFFWSPCSSTVAGLPSAATTSMPCSRRYACRACTCSFVTSTSSRQEATSAKVRKPRSRPSITRAWSSSTSENGASCSSPASKVLPSFLPLTLAPSGQRRRPRGQCGGTDVRIELCPEPSHPSAQTVNLRPSRPPYTRSGESARPFHR